jgi:hypothetical protein
MYSATVAGIGTCTHACGPAVDWIDQSAADASVRRRARIMQAAWPAGPVGIQFALGTRPDHTVESRVVAPPTVRRRLVGCSDRLATVDDV